MAAPVARRAAPQGPFFFRFGREGRRSFATDSPRSSTMVLLRLRTGFRHSSHHLPERRARRRGRSNPPGVERLEAREVPATLFAIDAAGTSLLRFDSATPNTIAATTAVTGLGTGEALQGIDFRPATGQLYGLAVAGVNARVVTINTTSGAITQVGASFTVSGVDFGFDFNPTVDRLRVVSDADINLSINPATGAVTTQTPLNPGTPTVVGSAYSNNFSGASTTVLYGIDSGSDFLVTQAPPASGTLTNVGAGLGFDTTG